MKKSPFYVFIQFIRSCIFVISLQIYTVFYSFICVAAYPLPLRYRCNLISAWTQVAVWLAKVICGVNYQVKGLENIPKDSGCVIVCKHQSTWETFFIPSKFNQIAIILKRELLWIPFFGWGLATTYPIAINRKNKNSAMTQIIKQGKKCLDMGRGILIFPEGTRIPFGKVGHYRLGGARLAVETGYPIIPVAHNAGLFWPKRHLYKNPGVVSVVIGEPIQTKGRTPEDVMHETQNWIESTIETLPKSI